MTKMGITLYGCEQDESVLFREMAPRFGVVPTITAAPVSEATIELARGNRCISVSHKTPITNAILRALSQAGVTYISTRSTGCNHIDVDFAQSVGISVETVVYSPDSVADYTLMLMLMAVRNATSTLSRAAIHDFRLNEVRGKELRDMTIGVIGTGRIGAAVMNRLRGFGCHILAYDHRPKTSANYGPLDELLQQSDMVTLHTPLNAETYHLLNRQRIEQMKHGAFIINTSTKDAVAAVLSRKAPTLKTYASYNHELGYPITLLRLEPQHRYAVLEMGAQRVGELTWLCNSIAGPHWSLITTVGAAHLEYFGSQERVAIGKSELVQILTPDGFAILNYDDERVRAMAAKTQARILSYGTGEGATVRASNIGGDPLFGRSFTLHYHDQQRPVQLRLPGEHGVTIALAAAATGCAAEIALDDIASALEDLSPPPGRCEIKPGPNNSTLIDDSFNANRQSIIANASAMHRTGQAPNGKRWAILGDIFQLGIYARAEHFACGASLAGLVDYLIAIGDQARFYVEGAIASGMPEENAYYFSADVNNSAELEAAKHIAADCLKHEVRPGDLVLLKGSRGMRMETMLAMLSSE